MEKIEVKKCCYLCEFIRYDIKEKRHWCFRRDVYIDNPFMKLCDQFMLKNGLYLKK